MQYDHSYAEHKLTYSSCDSFMCNSMINCAPKARCYDFTLISPIEFSFPEINYKNVCSIETAKELVMAPLRRLILK